MLTERLSKSSNGKGAKIMRDPLLRRIPREIKSEAGKYIVIFLFMIALIGVASGYFIADASLKAAYDESFELYNIEDGFLEFAEKPDDTVIEACEDEDITLYDNTFKDEPVSDGSTVRLFRIREEVDKTSLLKGRLPEAEDEIGLDRLYMKSNDLEMGDTIELDGKGYEITGIVALPDYSALYKDITDFMFDTEKFGVSVVTPEGFDRVNDSYIHWSYSWKYDDPPADVFGKEANERGDDLVKALAQKAVLTNFVPTCSNSSIKFAGNDLGHDRVMMLVMLDMLIVIVSFVFAVTTSNTITKEANVIGTLRASGYTKGEMLRHYLAAPVIVLLIASVIGNVLGYTVMKDIMADMYLGSYSLVSYKTLWNADAFIDTTVIPVLILLAINIIMLMSKLSLSPLKFIRRDLKRRQRKKALKLNTKIPIMTRYRLRVLLQNIPGYLTIFAGIFFASLIMLFSQLFDPLLDKFSEDSINCMIAQNIYILKAPVPTADEKAEKFAAGELKIVRGDFSESVSVYGIAPDSAYFHSRIKKDTVELSSAYADKYHLKAGDSVTLTDEYGSESYTFDISGIYDYPSTLVVFMNIDDFNDTFDLDENYFSGYFSDRELDDIDDAYIASIVTEDEVTKTSRQLKRSMGNMMSIFVILGVAVIILVVYLLSKVMIEKNAQSISVAKILGYEPREISGIYIRTTTIVTVLSFLLCIPLETVSLDALWRGMMTQYPGWLAPDIPLSAYVKTIAMGIVTYLVTTLLLKRKINKVPMDEALKNTE